MAKLRLAGVSFSNPDGQSRKEILGRLFMEVWTEGHEVPVELVPEDDNPHDPHAVAVYTVQVEHGEPETVLPRDLQGKQVGYVPAEHAAKVREALERGLVGHVRLAHMAAGSRGGISALIGIARADRDPDERVVDDLATTEELRGRLDRYGAAIDGSPTALRAVSDELDDDVDVDVEDDGVGY